jgi:hypothetical protein
MSEINLKKSFVNSNVNKLYLEWNEELNLYETVIERTLYYRVEEYQKAYDNNGNEIGEIKVNSYITTEEETKRYSYRDNERMFGNITIHFNNGVHLIAMDRLYTIDEIRGGVDILNRSKINNTIFTYDEMEISQYVEGFMSITDKKKWREILKSQPDFNDKLVNRYINIVNCATYSPFNWGEYTVKEGYTLNTNIQMSSIGHSRCIYSISEDPFNEEQYDKSIKEMVSITSDICNTDEYHYTSINMIYQVNKGFAKINNSHKLIYHFDINYKPKENKLRITGVIDNNVINESYDTNLVDTIDQVREFFTDIIDEGVYITNSQTEQINKELDKLKDKSSDEVKEILKEVELKDYYKPIITTKPTQTYLMKNKRNGLYKIGRSINPLQREKTLQSEEPEIEMVKVWEDNIESILHRKYTDQRVRGEWFELNKTQVKYICTNKW